MSDFLDKWNNGILASASPALEKARLALTVAGTLVGLDGWSGEAAAAYIWVFDSNVAVPNGNPPTPWPKHIIQVAPLTNGNFGLSEVVLPENFTNGIYVACSLAVPPNFTLTANNLTHFNVLRQPLFGGGNP